MGIQNVLYLVGITRFSFSIMCNVTAVDIVYTLNVEFYIAVSTQFFFLLYCIKPVESGMGKFTISQI